MSDNSLQSAIKKVQLLLNLTKNNTSENEVKAAASAADRIMQEYRITQAMLEAQGVAQQEPMVTKVVHEGGRRTAWREVLLHAITDHYGACWWLSSYRSGGDRNQGRSGSKGIQSYTVVGREGDVAIVEYMFAHLSSEVERLCRWHAGGKGVKFAGGWLMGCAQGLREQFSDMRIAARAASQANAQENTCAALVLLDKRGSEAKTYMKEKIGTRSATAVHGAQDYSARSEGFGVGKSMAINTALPQGATNAKLVGA